MFVFLIVLFCFRSPFLLTASLLGTLTQFNTIIHSNNTTSTHDCQVFFLLFLIFDDFFCFFGVSMASPWCFSVRQKIAECTWAMRFYRFAFGFTPEWQERLRRRRIGVKGIISLSVSKGGKPLVGYGAKPCIIVRTFISKTFVLRSQSRPNGIRFLTANFV